MKTIQTFIHTHVYVLFALTIAVVAFFAVLPLVSDINPDITGPSFTAGLVAAFDGGGDAGGDAGGDSSGDAGGDAGGSAGDAGGDSGGTSGDAGANTGSSDTGSGVNDGGFFDNFSQSAPAPTCTLTANPTSVNQGQSSTLSWTTQNATAVSIDQTIGAVALNGTKSVAPSQTTTYTLTATGAGGTVTCAKTVTVVLPAPEAPTCTLTANPTSVNQGQSSTLSWTTQNATAVSIDQTIGAVALNGTKSVAPSQTTTYTLTATGAGGTVTCAKTVTVVPPAPEEGQCALEIAKVAEPSSVKVGDTITYTLNFKNIGTADCTGGGVRIEDTLDSMVTYMSETHSVNVSAGYGSYGVYDAGSHKMGWNAHTLTPGETGSVSFVVKVKAPTSCGNFTVHNTGKISAYELNNFGTWVKSNDVSTNVSNACETPVPPQCPFSSAENRTIVNFDEIRLISNQVKKTNTEQVSLSQGTYTITLASWDGYVGRENVSQAHEQWKVVVANESGIIMTSNPSGDVADYVRESLRTDVVNTNLVLSTSGTSVYGEHAFYTDTSSPNSVVPICVAFDKKPAEPVLPTCTLTANPTSVNQGQSSTLSWTTQNATAVSIDQTIGAVALNGTKSVAPSQTTTYTLTATGAGGTVSCVASLVVENEPEPTPLTCDAFSASPSTLTASGSTTLMWSTTNATSVSINNGVGSVSVDGSKEVYVSNSTTFTLTATKGEETITCQAPVMVAPVAIVPKCDAFSVNPTSVNKGDTVKLSWNTTNATAVSINNGVGAVSVDGDINMTVDADTTYTLTATNGNATDTCQATVAIKSSGGGGGSSSPRCELTASRKTIKAGEKVTLSWKNVRTNDILLKDSRGNVIVDSKKDTAIDEDEGSVVVKPTKSTSYTLTAIRGSKDRECTVDINVSNVSVSSSRSQDPLVAGISLSKLPYTGFDAGPFLTTTFYVLLALWGLGIGYVLVIKQGTLFGMSLSGVQGVKTGRIVSDVPVSTKLDINSPAIRESIMGSVHVPSVQAPYALPVAQPANAPIGYEALYEVSQTPIAVETIVETAPVIAPTVDGGNRVATLEMRAHDAQVLISSDALQFIVAQSQNEAERVEILDMIIDVAKATYPSEDGWVVVNKARILELVKN